jgi:hypothetical protein
MIKKRELRPESQFILDHFDDYQAIIEAIEEAKRDIEDILTLIQDDLTKEKWWCDEFESKINKNKKGIWITNKDWKRKDGYPFFGLENIALEALVGEGDTAWSYIVLPSQYRNQENKSVFKKYVNSDTILKAKPGWTNNNYHSLARDFNFSKIAKNITDIKDFLVKELNDMSFVIPIVDKIIK